MRLVIQGHQLCGVGSGGFQGAGELRLASSTVDAVTAYARSRHCILQDVEFELLHIVSMPQDTYSQGQEVLSSLSWLSDLAPDQEEVRQQL